MLPILASCAVWSAPGRSAADEVVAIKTVDASRFRSISEIEQMQEEMNVSASLKHPNIVRLYEVHFNNNIFYLVRLSAASGWLAGWLAGWHWCLGAERLRLHFLPVLSALPVPSSLPPSLPACQVMELSSGGSLMSHIHADAVVNCLDEAETKRLFAQMVSALDYCHRR